MMLIKFLSFFPLLFLSGCLIEHPYIVQEFNTFTGDKSVWLPFEDNQSVLLLYGESESHNGANVHAIDFIAEEGTPIVAARSGVVTRVSDASDSGCPEPSCAYDANIILIASFDYTYDAYLHFQKDSIPVKINDYVCRGQFLGLVGNTGWSTRPHLHYQINDELHQSQPISFVETGSVEDELIPSEKNLVVSGNYLQCH